MRLLTKVLWWIISRLRLARLAKETINSVDLIWMVLELWLSLFYSYVIRLKLILNFLYLKIYNFSFQCEDSISMWKLFRCCVLLSNLSWWSEISHHWMQSTGVAPFSHINQQKYMASCFPVAYSNSTSILWKYFKKS